ncbi:GDP-D-glucose phosphorylase 1 [Anthophora retusa]
MYHKSFNKANDDCIQNDKEDKKSSFDSTLTKAWEEAQKNGLFRYVLNIQDTKILDGKYKFLVQLNIDRGYNRRCPENITSMKQPFNENQFNFTKLAPEEQIMNLNSTNEEDVIAINVSPMEYCHSLLLPQKYKQLPQVVTKYSLYKAVELFSLSSSLYLRVGFNSLCAYASVNHLHWHLYYLNWNMLLEYIDLKEYAGPVQILYEYPAKGFCIKYSNVRNMDDFVDWAFLLINYLQNAEVAHNVYITRAKLDSEGEYEDLRIYIWARKPAKGSKDTAIFNPAICEFFGHLSIKSEEVYKNLTEERVTCTLREVTEETFFSVYDKIKNLIEDRINIAT